jgi:eukaryotic-like serine/threonine-protein kinase
MTSDRWRQIEDLFHSALDRPSEDRADFLDASCDRDVALRLEVERLLKSFDEAGDFIEKPVLDDSLFSSSETSGPSESLIGRRISNYEILSLVGVGGMGEVYLARDARLNRQIALKLLSARFMADPGQVERFEREARAASALNHPNIITIHEIGRDGDAHFITTEFVQGRTLREIIAEGKLRLRESLAIGFQIAGALAAAHAAGIVHRDIKPENVMVRGDGLVKLLDFGLAKLVGDVETEKRRDEEKIPLSFCPSAPLSSPHYQTTDPRMLMGTLAYLSPEQARGGMVDHRTDIFSLGVMLYEMVAEARPFIGESPIEILDAILKRQPEPLPPGKLSPELDHIIDRALRKDRDARYQSANDLYDDLQRLSRHLEMTEQRDFWRAPRPGRAPSYLTKAAALAVLIAVATTAWLAWRAAASKTGNVSSPLPSPWIDAVSTKLTGYPGHELFPSLAPDGQSFVYSRRQGDQYDIFLERIGEAQARNLTHDSENYDDWMAAFSPDGSRIAFRSERDGGGIFLMDAGGGNVRRLTEEGFNPAWSPDGKEIVYATSPANSPHSRENVRSQLMVVNVETRERRRIDIGSGKDAVQPSWSPNGARIAYWGLHDTDRDIWTVPARGGEPAQVTNDDATDWNPVWSPDGEYLYFASDSRGAMRFWRAPIDQTTGRVTGEREAVTGAGAESWHPSFSRDGKKLAFVNYIAKESIQCVGFDPQRETVVGAMTPVTSGERRVTAPDLSPDGQWLAFYTFGSPQEDIFVTRRDGSEPRQLTNDRRRDRVPRWAPDGKRIAFYSDRSRNYEIWTIDLDGGELRRLTECAPHHCFYPTWSPDGKRLGFYESGVNTFIIEPDQWPDKQSMDQTPQPLPSRQGDAGHFQLWSWSPDGQKLAGVWRGGKSSGVFTYSLATREYEQITDFGSDPVWLGDNRRMFFIFRNNLYLVDIRSRRPRHVVLPSDLLRVSLVTPARGDQKIYLSLISQESDIQLLSLK